jgi:hypothetical protein
MLFFILAQKFTKISIDCKFRENRRSDGHTLLSLGGGALRANGISIFKFDFDEIRCKRPANKSGQECMSFTKIALGRP